MDDPREGSAKDPEPQGAKEPEPQRVKAPSRYRAGSRVDRNSPCMNCGDPTPGEYCPSCGQRKVGVRVSVRTLVMEVLEDQFLLDRRLPRTLTALLFQPGRLTVEHIEGRIVRYIHPFRLYLVTSLLFFLLLSFFSLQLVRRAMDGDGPGIVRIEDGGGGEIRAALEGVRAELADPALDEEAASELRQEEAVLLQRLRTARMDSLEERGAELDQALARIDELAADSAIPDAVRNAVVANRPTLVRQRDVALAQRDTLLADTLGADSLGLELPPSTPDQERPLSDMFGWDENPPTVSAPFGADSALAGQIRRIGEMTPKEALESLVGTFFNYVPTLMFILLPVFAAVLKLLYIRRGRYYAEHFVFLLHVHSVVFILATVMLLIRSWVPGWVEALLIGWILVYILLAMKRVYAQGWAKTFFKYWTLGWMYFWILVITMPFALLATVLLI